MVKYYFISPTTSYSCELEPDRDQIIDVHCNEHAARKIHDKSWLCF